MKISIRKYAEALASSLMGEKDEQKRTQKVQNFLMMLRRKKKIRILKRFLSVFDEVWNEKNGRIKAKVVLPKEPTENELGELAQSLGKSLNKEVIVDLNVDLKIIGGLKIEFGDYVIDGTVRKNLEMLKSKLIYSNN